MSNIFIGFPVNREGQIKSPLHNVCPSIPRNRIYSHMLLHCCTVGSVGPINSSLKNTYLKKNECPTQVGCAIFSQSKAHILQVRCPLVQIGFTYFLLRMNTSCRQEANSLYRSDEHILQVGYIFCWTDAQFLYRVFHET